MVKTVVFLCGLIGSGKSTYAVNNFKAFTDLDLIKGYSTKQMQIDWTKRLLETNDTVCHITSFPSELEEIEFEGINKVYYWMDTTLEQSVTNILIRNRKRDIENFGSVILANKKYIEMFYKSSYHWVKIYVF